VRDIGKNIRQIREAAGITQEALAETLFVTRQTVSNYETGRSRPDIDMLLRIAEVLHTDVNALIYGPPVPEDRRNARKWAIIAGVAFVILLGAYWMLYGLAEESQLLSYMAPTFLLQISLRPVMLFMMGWLLMHCIGLFCGLKPVSNKWVRIVLYVLLGVLAVIPLPFVVWMLVLTVKKLITHGPTQAAFPNIPVYFDLMYMIVTMYSTYPFVMALVGSVCWLFGIPFKPKQTNRTEKV